MRIYYSDLFKAHINGPNHPECPDRLNAAVKAIRNRYTVVAPDPAPEEAVRTIHTRRYMKFIEQHSSNGGGPIDPDTGATSRTYDAALLACGAGINAVDTVIDGNEKRAFCAVRPPGHHAEANRAMGFCIFNNIAVAAAHALERELERVAIVDWDVHHGNGTQNAFYSCGDVFYVSLHQYPAYPGTGRPEETGEKAGAGTTLNLPLPPGTGSLQFEEMFNARVIPALTDYNPELILISAGFDAHVSDPLAAIRLETETFGTITRLLVELAETCAHGRIISFLEGGYNLDALRDSVACHLENLSD